MNTLAKIFKVTLVLTLALQFKLYAYDRLDSKLNPVLANELTEENLPQFNSDNISELIETDKSYEQDAFLQTEQGYSCYAVKNQGRNFKYCISTTATDRPTEVLYYFHGLLGDEKQFFKDKRALKAREIWGQHSPTIVTISYGPEWLLVKKNSRPNSGLLKHFQEKALPYIESKLDFKPTKRYLVGASMGGANVLSLYFDNPKLFDKYAALCPAIMGIGPFVSKEERKKYASLTNAKMLYVQLARFLMWLYFPTNDLFNKENPLFKTSQLNSQSPNLYLSCGRQDQFGFFYGTNKFFEDGLKKKAPLAFSPLEGGHCTFDSVALAQYFMN
jgi:hypothetical protein